MAKLRIIKSSLPTYWYADKIGKEFEAEITPVIKDALVDLGIDTARGCIDFGDYEIIQDDAIKGIERRTEEVAVNSTKDPISPEYYKGKIECIEAIQEATKDLQGIEAVDTGQIIKYIWRWKKKNGVEDLKKCKFYLEHLINHIENA
jgi:hypothetical protein